MTRAPLPASPRSAAQKNLFFSMSLFLFCQSARRALGLSTATLDAGMRSVIDKSLPVDVLDEWVRQESELLVQFLWVTPAVWNSHVECFAQLMHLAQLYQANNLMASVPGVAEDAPTERSFSTPLIGSYASTASDWSSVNGHADEQDPEAAQERPLYFDFPIFDDSPTRRKRFMCRHSDCATRGRTYASTCAVRKHAHRRHGDWVRRLKPSEFACEVRTPSPSMRSRKEPAST